MTELGYIILFVALLIFEVLSISRNPQSFARFLRFFYVYILCFGHVFLVFMDKVYPYKFTLTDMDRLAFLLASGYAALVAGHHGTRLLQQVFAPKSPQTVDRSEGPFLGRSLSGLFLVSLTAISAYVGMTGLNFGSGSYEQRYEDAQGLGLILLFFPAFMPFVTYRMIQARNTSGLVAAMMVGLAISCSTMFILNGYRQIFIGMVIVTIVVLIQKKRISPLLFFSAGVILLPLLSVFLAFARYSGEASNPFSDALQEALYYIQGDLFPVDAPLRIMWFCESTVCPGVDVFTNHLMRIVPRALWAEKPIIMFDAAGYYTQVVLAYPRLVTLSSTIAGEGLLIGRFSGVVTVCLLSGCLATLLDSALSRYKNTAFYYILCANIYIGFFWIREGLENAVYRILVMLIFVWVGAVVARILPKPVFGRRPYPVRGPL